MIHYNLTNFFKKTAATLPERLEALEHRKKTAIKAECIIMQNLIEN